MAATVANMVGKRMVKGQMKTRLNYDDLYFFTDERIDKHGNRTVVVHKPKLLGFIKKKPKKFPQPEGLTAAEEAILQKVKGKAYTLDMAIGEVGGTNFGLATAIGVIPVLGDFGSTALALLLVQEIRKIEPPLSASQQLTMLIRIGLQFGVGAVPILGDVVDGVYKANSRNVAALQRELEHRVAKREKALGASDKERLGRRGDQPGFEGVRVASEHRGTERRRIQDSERRRGDDDYEMRPDLPPRNEPEMRQRMRHY